MSTTPKFSRLDPGQRREQILDAANALFAERAYDEVSIEDIARCRRRHPRARAPLLRRSQGGLHRAARAARRPARGRLRPPVGRSARARVADTVSRWLDWTEAEPHDLARHDRARRGHRRPRRQARGRRPRAPRRRAARGSSRRHRRGLAAAALRARVLDRAQPRRDATLAAGEATREATHELLASTLEHVLRTFGARSAPAGAASLLPETDQAVPRQAHGERCPPLTR